MATNTSSSYAFASLRNSNRLSDVSSDALLGMTEARENQSFQEIAAEAEQEIQGPGGLNEDLQEYSDDTSKRNIGIAAVSTLNPVLGVTFGLVDKYFGSGKDKPRFDASKYERMISDRGFLFHSQRNKDFINQLKNTQSEVFNALSGTLLDNTLSMIPAAMTGAKFGKAYGTEIGDFFGKFGELTGMEKFTELGAKYTERGMLAPGGLFDEKAPVNDIEGLNRYYNQELIEGIG